MLLTKLYFTSWRSVTRLGQYNDLAKPKVELKIVITNLHLFNCLAHDSILIHSQVIYFPWTPLPHCFFFYFLFLLSFTSSKQNTKTFKIKVLMFKPFSFDFQMMINSTDQY